MKVAWLTDTHLNFIRNHHQWWGKIARKGYDAAVVTGDIASATILDKVVTMFGKGKIPVYFVLGNHDYYGGSIVETRRRLAGLPAATHGPNAHYLGNGEAVRLTPKSVLVGDDGWYDGRNGDYRRSDVELNDFYHIRELTGLSKDARLSAMQALAQESANRLEELCLKASGFGAEHMYVATHVPPFAGAAWHMGQLSDEFFQPFFSSRVSGEAIVRGTADFRNAGGKVTVLCGHSHSEGAIYPYSGMEVLTGKAEYGNPQVYKVLEVA